MDFFDVIKTRHSYRGKFMEKKISHEDLAKIVESGIMAPSGKNAQTTCFIIIDNPEILNEIRAIVQRPVLETAPAMILVCSKTKIAFEGFAFEREDYAAAVENMLLSITALGLASVWLDGVLRLNNIAEKLEKFFNLPQDVHASVLLPVGYPATREKPNTKKPFAERAAFNKFPV